MSATMSATLSLVDPIAAWIAQHGVTKCPIAFAAPTHATVSLTASLAHIARGPDPVGQTYRKTGGGWTAFWRKTGGKGSLRYRMTRPGKGWAPQHKKDL